MCGEAVSAVEDALNQAFLDVRVGLQFLQFLLQVQQSFPEGRLGNLMLVDMFCSGMVLGIVGNLKSTTVILEDFAVDLCLGHMDHISKLLHLF